MVAGERTQEQPRELVPDRLAEATGGRWAAVLDALEAGTVLEDEGEPAAGLRLGGVHNLVIGAAAGTGDPSAE